jgi:hypothetical protein
MTLKATLSQTGREWNLALRIRTVGQVSIPGRKASPCLQENCEAILHGFSLIYQGEIPGSPLRGRHNLFQPLSLHHHIGAHGAIQRVVWTELQLRIRLAGWNDACAVSRLDPLRTPPI